MGSSKETFWLKEEVFPVVAKGLNVTLSLRSEASLEDAADIPPESILRLAVEIRDFPHSFVGFLSTFGPMYGLSNEGLNGNVAFDLDLATEFDGTPEVDQSKEVGRTTLEANI
ncbi:hypothetical protein F0562_013708 [Nyssa sinensis]|uniref:Uncharacterized protein n=1 Tax=Nyssa sinensis TaxID=561372 RepID=A0A5J4ZQJ2_9ASTE|nr:hypothetical protein F0562_013708 [Nyssa sinensis]